MIHIDGPGELTRDSEDEIRAVRGVVYHAASHGVTGGWKGTGGEHYHERWRRVEGKWLLASLKMVRGFWKVSQLEGAEKEVV
jgi:hypothetical protein